MKNPDPGYPLPSGEAYTDDFACQLVYIPNKDEYWRAFLGAIHYFANWVAWQRDSEKRGKDAAQAWREANELTMECWRMTCLDDITDRMDVMIDLLGNQSGCCGTTTIGPIITVTTIIVPGVGDDPTHWGETEVVDWAEWLEYVCYHAHVYVDSLIEGAKAIDIAIELGSYTIDFFVGVMRFMQYLGLDQVLGLNQVMMVYDDFRKEVDMSGWFTPLAARFEAAREDIVCAILQGGSLSDAVEAAVNDNAVWLLFYVLTDYDAVQALIYEATVDSVEYLSPIKRDDCECEDYGEDEYGIWEGEYHVEWDRPNLTQILWGPFGCSTNGYPDWRILSAIRNEYNAIFGISNVSWKLNRIEFDYMFETGGSSEVTNYQIRVRALSDRDPSWVWSVVWTQASTGAGGTWDEWHHAVITDAELPDEYCSLHDRRPMYFEFSRGVPQLNRRFRLKNVELWVEHE